MYGFLPVSQFLLFMFTASRNFQTLFRGAFEIPILRIPLHYTENADERCLLSDKRFPELMFGDHDDTGVLI